MSLSARAKTAFSPEPNLLAETRQLLGRLVAFDTTSHRSNLPLIEFVRSYLAGLGIQSELTPSGDGNKASLFATMGPPAEGGIGLSSHSDCVPVERQDWSSDPFTLSLRDGRLYGRGTCDMKGFLACTLAAIPLFQSQDLKQPVHILLSYDEEVGCTGVRPLIARLGRDLPRPRAIIVGEPSGMGVIDAHKRIDAYRTMVTGREAHSSMPQLGVNAIAIAAQLICELERTGASLEEELREERFDPPVSTIQVGLIEGGTATNIVPRSCSFRWQVRSLPGADSDAVPSRLAAYAETLLPAMRQVAKHATIETRREGSVPAFLAKPDSEAVSLALKLAGANETHAVSYATEAGLFEEAGCPSVICGPGDIAQAHAADEFVSLEQLEACLSFLTKLGETLSR